MELNRGVFLIFFMFFLFFTPAGNPPRFLSPEERDDLKKFVNRQQRQLSLLQNSTWETGYDGLIGFKEYPEMPAQPGSILPAEIFNEARSLWVMEPSEEGNEQSGAAVASPQNMKSQLLNGNEHDGGSAGGSISYYHNVSGLIRGRWEKLDVPLIPINMTIPSHPNGSNDTANGTTTIEELHPPKHIYRNEIEALDANPINTGNLTGSSGDLYLEVNEKINNFSPNSSVSLLESTIEMSDPKEDVTHTIKLEGVHIKSTGNFILSTTSFKFSGKYAIPHLLLSREMFDESKGLIVNRLNSSLSILDQLVNSKEGSLHDVDQGYSMYENSVNAAEKCEYIVYGHIHSSGLTQDELRDVEDELAHPLGRPHKQVPYIKADAILYSPDCGIALETKEPLEGERIEYYYQRVRRTIMLAVVLLLLQTVLTAIQMKDTNTPSTLSRVSFYSIGLMSIFDGAICMASVLSSFVEFVTLPFMAVVFVAFALTSLFEMRYMVLIYRSQIFESFADARAREATAGGPATFLARPDGTFISTSTTETNNNTGNSTPSTASTTRNDDSEGELPTTERQNNDTTTPNQTQPSPEEVDERQIMGTIYSRFYFTLLAFLLISVMATSWPEKLKIIYQYFAMLVLYSLWLPQIYRNFYRGSRRSFLWKYVLGTSCLRVSPVLYICLDRHNFLNHRYDPQLACVIVGWLWIQICILSAQNIFGPRFFLPRKYQSTLYDYHPIITEDDLESGMNYTSLGDEMKPSTTTGSGNNDIEGEGSTKKPADEDLSRAEDSLLSHGEEHHPTVDCAICMMPIEMVIVPKGRSHLASTPANILARRRYMVTPCRHVFHTECMETWMRTRLQCPVCRNPLPPI